MKNKKVVVIGAVSVDIFGQSDSQIVNQDSNPGRVEFSFGGVGRNIANNIAKLGIDVELIAPIGDDFYADNIQKHCQKEGIGLNHCFKTNGNTPVYLAINQPNGEMQCAIADFSLVNSITIEFLKSKLDFINSCDLVVIDTNWNSEIMNFLFNNITTKIFVDPVSTTKAKKIINFLDKITVLKPNLIEAKTLTNSNGDCHTLVKKLNELGVKEVYLTMSQDGVCIGDTVIENYVGEIKNTTGCGDAFLSGIIYGDLLELSNEEKAKHGLAAASICAMSSNSISEHLNSESIKEKICN